MHRQRNATKRQRSKRTLNYELLEQRDLLAVGDVRVEFEFVDSGGNPVSSLQVGDAFSMRVNIQDARSSPTGLLRSYFDLTYPAALATVDGPLTHGPAYNIATSGNALTPGLVDEVGGLDSDAFPPSSPGGKFLLFTLPLRAQNVGTLSFTANPADSPTFFVQFFSLAIVPLNDITFVGNSIEIRGGGINVTPTTGLTTTEAGGTATFQIVLTRPPTANVTVGLSTSDSTEGTIAPTSVVFTPANFNSPQTVTVTGADDAANDGDVGFAIDTAAATSSDPAYNGVNPSNVLVTNIDNDTPGITVAPTSGLVTTEPNGTATFQIRLNSQPTANVTIDLSSSDTTECTVSPVRVIFTPTNFNTPQTITVTGVDDLLDDGAVGTTIVTAPAVSADLDYNNVDAVNISVTNDDNDVPGFNVVPTSGLVTSENGGSATFQISLMSQPTSNVTVALSSSNANEGTVSPSSVVFNAGNFNIPQTVTVTGVDGDLVADGDVSYMIVTAPAVSGDPSYSGRKPANVSVTNQDNENPGFIVVPTSGLVTSEAGGSATFQISLTSRPNADVTISVSSSDATEGTASPNSVTFNGTNWDIPRTITVSGVDDDVDDGSVDYLIDTAPATSSDPSYNNRDPRNVGVTNSDNDVANFLVVPTSGLVTTEAGGSATFQISLTSRPTANVAVGLTSSNTGEGTVSPASVTLTPANWNVPQTVTVRGVDERIDDGDVEYLIVTAPATSADPGYNIVNPADVGVTNADNDQAGFVIVPTSGLVTSEEGGTASFQISLTAQPTANVTIGLTSSDTTEGTVSQSSVTFTSANWNTPQTVTVTGVDDSVDDEDVAYTISTGSAASSDASYSGREVSDVAVTNTDNEQSGVVIDPSVGLRTTEAGGTATFEVTLSREPAANVTFDLASGDLSEGTVAPSRITFSRTNWNVPQSITMSGVNDNFVDGDRNYLIVTSSAASADPIFNGVDVADVSVTNADDESAALTLTAPEPLSEGTAAGNTTFVFQATLSFAVEGGFTVPYSANDGTATAASGDYVDNDGTLTFQGTAGETHTIVVQANRDIVVEAAERFQVALGQLANISAAAASRITVSGSPGTATILNDDTATLTLAGESTTQNEGTGPGTKDLTFDVTLSAPVQGGFRIAYTLEGTATAADGDFIDNVRSLSFTGTAGEKQSITVRVNQDRQVELDESFQVALGEFANLESEVAANISRLGGPISTTLLNDDAATLNLSAASASQNEGTGGAATDFIFQAVLSNPVQGGLNIGFATRDGSATAASGDYVNSSGTLTFTSSESGAKSIIVKVNQDNVVEPDERFQLALGLLSGVNPALAALVSVDTAPVEATIVDDDRATISFAAASSTALEASAAHAIDVRLSVPNSGTLSEEVRVTVTILPTSGAGTPADFSLNNSTLIFPAGSRDGDVRTINLSLVIDEIMEQVETIDLQISSDGAVSIGRGQHVVSLTDDPLTGRIAGLVWIDTNANGLLDDREMGVPGTTVILTGHDTRGQVVRIELMTNADGSYAFDHLPGGTYRVTESQPAALHDGQEVLGKVQGTQGTTGQTGPDEFLGIVLGPSQQATGYNFAESSLRANSVTNRLFLTSTHRAITLRDLIVDAEEQIGNGTHATLIRHGESVEVRRIGSEVTVIGTGTTDVIKFSPAQSVSGVHILEVNGSQFTFAAADVKSFIFIGSEGDDELLLDDSAGSEQLSATRNEVFVTGDDYRAEAAAFEFIRAISDSGGQDKATNAQQAVDYILQLQGNWIRG